MDVRQSALRRAFPMWAPSGTYPCGRQFVRRLKPTRRPCWSRCAAALAFAGESADLDDGGRAQR